MSRKKKPSEIKPEEVMCGATDCFANSNSKCRLLDVSIKPCDKCPFRKTIEQYREDKRLAFDRIMSLEGGDKLWQKYHGNDRVNERHRLLRAKKRRENNE